MSLTQAQRVDSFHYIPGGAEEAKLEIVVAYGEGHHRTDTFTLQEIVKTLKLPDHNPTLIALWHLVELAIGTESLDAESHITYMTLMTQLSRYTGENASAEYTKEQKK